MKPGITGEREITSTWHTLTLQSPKGERVELVLDGNGLAVLRSELDKVTVTATRQPWEI